ncbi:NADH:flavin oxidoreductase/NADH oxidase family protein [Streptomyces sp. NPDC012746]|uniref:NADH:flavin oxidoreductase/NADH oxidase family protein n=1 Tax=Streptomyces sp. NPDC012746 TaxID=3364845 RepID=UPI0036A8CD17
MVLFEPLTLPGGATLPNRVAKAAMEESLAGPGQLPDARVEQLYRGWAHGGAGLLITGNVMVDRRALTSPGTILLDADSPLAPFRRWARAASSGGNHVWMQINHPGRQVGSDMPGVAWAPSDVAISLGRHTKRFARPTMMTEADIEATVARFAVTARRAEEAGFHGVQIHAAHGYLLSQFLSPLVNRRTDRWGGSPENRSRLLSSIVRAVRAQVSDGFAIGVKLNTADFQRGGFDLDDAARVIETLGGLGVELVELSGGTVESPASMGSTTDHRRLGREAYFLAFTGQLLESATMPLMLTGGISTRETAERVREQGVAVVGMASALALRPDLPRCWREGSDARVGMARVDWKDRSLAAAGVLAYVRYQLRRLADGKTPRPHASPRRIFLADALAHRRRLRTYRTWLAANPTEVH